MSGFAFGLIIGYLSWHAFRPGLTPDAVPLQKIAAFLAIIGGATVLTLFPTGSLLFEYYGMGLALGFFFTPSRSWLAGVLQRFVAFIKRTTVVKKSERKREFEAIEENWFEIERLIHHKLDAVSRADEDSPRFNYIDITDLQELQYSQTSIENIMRRFAQAHIREGIEYKVRSGKPALWRKRW